MENEDSNIDLKKLNVLLVEDDTETTVAFSRLLRYMVGDVTIAYNGRDGLAKALEINPDVIITDIEMPEMNGLELLREIKKWNAKKVVVVVTAFEDQAERAREADAIIIKPVQRSILQKTLEEISHAGDLDGDSNL